MSKQVRLVFFGEVLEGFEEAAVQRDVPRKLRRDGAKLFSGQRVVLHEAIAQDAADLLVAELRALGARVHAEEVEALPPLSFLSLDVPAPPAESTQAAKSAMAETDSSWQTLREGLDTVDNPGRGPGTSQAAAAPAPARAQAPAQASAHPPAHASAHASPTAFPSVPSVAAFPPVPAFDDAPAHSSASWPAPSQAPSPAVSPAAAFAAARSSVISPDDPVLAVSPPASAALPPVASAPSAAAAPVPQAPAGMALKDSLGAPPRADVPEAALLVACPTCGERQPMRVLCRACSTDLQRALAAKAEEREISRAEQLQALRMKRGLNPDGTAMYADAASIWGLGFDGRLARWPYAASGLFAYSAMAWLALAMAKGNGFVVLVSLLGLILVVVWALRLTVLRLHDVNLRWQWMLLFLVPYVGNVASLMLMVWPGTPEENDYGGPARPGNWVMALFAMLVLAATVGMGWRTLNTLLKEETEDMDMVAIEGAGDSGAHAPGAPQAPTPQPAPAPSLPPLIMVSPPPDSEIAAKMNGAQAIAGFKRDYWPMGQNKAFAVASDGAWGWRGGMASVTKAVAEALAECETHRNPQAGECKVVNINGYWQE